MTTAPGGPTPVPSVLTKPPTATISFTALLPVSATKTLPLPSTATPEGSLNPPPIVFTIELDETTPPTATISFTKLLPMSVTKTLPLPSTATLKGSLNPLPIVFTVVLLGKVTSGPVPVP